MDIPSGQPVGLRNTTPRPRHRRRGWQEWRGILTATFEALISDRCSMAAAGCAFYATLALFPAISTLVSIYGLVLSPASVEQQLNYLRGLLPMPAFELIAGRVHDLVTQPPAQLGFRLVLGLVITFWSAATGTKSVLSALNVAYNVDEQRSFLRFQAVALGMTLAAMLVAVLGIAVLVFVPVVIEFIGLEAHAAALIHAAGMVMLLAFVAVSTAVLYRVGPSSARKQVQRIAPGTTVATLLWLVASILLTFYVANLSSFGATYGPLAAVVGVMLWFWVSVYAVLVGAQLNVHLDAAEAPPRMPPTSPSGEAPVP